MVAGALAGKPGQYLIYGAFAFVGVIVFAVLLPAFFMVMLFLLLIVGIGAFAPGFAGTHAGIAVILVLLGLAAVFGFFQIGQTASLGIVHALP